MRQLTSASMRTVRRTADMARAQGGYLTEAERQEDAEAARLLAIAWESAARLSGQEGP